MIYVLVPLIVTWISVSSLWVEYAGKQTQGRFNVAATATFYVLLSNAVTSFVLYLQRTAPVQHDASVWFVVVVVTALVISAQVRKARP